MNTSTLPQHVAIIMDGNGRWASERALARIEGHRVGVQISEEIITAARKIKINYLTLYAFSRENWQRPADEVASLMQLLKEFLLNKRQKMLDEGIRLNAIGNLSLLPEEVLSTLNQVMKDTSHGKDMVLTLALSYGSRDEIIRAIGKVVEESLGKGSLVSGFDEARFDQYLDTAGMPDPDLIIRTSGEARISNFLLWQGAYAEYLFEECYWPDFSRAHFIRAIEEYQRRERRYGRIK